MRFCPRPHNDVSRHEARPAGIPLDFKNVISIFISIFQDSFFLISGSGMKLSINTDLFSSLNMTSRNGNHMNPLKTTGKSNLSRFVYIYDALLDATAFEF